MQRAILLAATHNTHPNPRVGAVVVDGSGQVVGEGAHEGAGSPHAEIVALTKAGERAKGSTLYVTLEPCAHQGRTPPCARAVVDAGVSRVVLAVVDPDPRVSGAGLSLLTDAGVEVESGLMAEEAEAVDPAYFRHRRTGLPLVTLKLAMTIDGAVAAQDASSQWITSAEARRDAHVLRSAMDAVVVGAGTLRHDDPLLTARHEGGAAQPIPVVIVGGEDDWPDPEASARALADRGLLDVLLEGGPTLAGSWWRTGIVGRGVIYVGARIGGGQGIGPLGGDFATVAQSRPVNIRDVHMVGPDIRIEFD